MGIMACDSAHHGNTGQFSRSQRKKFYSDVCDGIGLYAESLYLQTVVFDTTLQYCIITHCRLQYSSVVRVVADV